MKADDKLFFFLYSFIKSIISNSPLFEGFSLFEYSTTFLSKKYNPVIALFEIYFEGFSTIFIILLFFLFYLAIPNNSGFLIQRRQANLLAFLALKM